MDLIPLLHKMIEHQASDLFVSVGAPPIIKIEGQSLSLGSDIVTAAQAQKLAYSIMDEEKTRTFETSLELNLALSLDQIGRFRVNVFRQRGEPAMVVRYVKSHVPSIEELGLPKLLCELIMEERGLILVVGGTGTGKSTTLASMIDYRNSHHAGHILTVEDPVEFIHEHKKSLVNQREVGLDTLSYENALKNALREAPDVIMIGECRDLDTMKHAVSYAETGHLCITTLHANNANQALERVLNFFPETAQRQLYLDLSSHLKAVISQRLAIGIDGKRVAAVEIMVNTPYISELIQKGQFEKIKDAMIKTEGRIGQTFDEALYRLYKEEKITEQEALRLADSRNNLSLKIRLTAPKQQTQGAEEKTVKYNKNAPFDDYTTFTVTPLKVSNKRRPDSQQLLNEAISNDFRNKGYLKVNQNPDIDVQYVLGIKESDKLALVPMEGEEDPFTSISEDSDSHASLLINIIDCKTKKPVWRLNYSRELKGPLLSQEEVNAEFGILMQDYPDVNK
ncbi:MAG: PilT/PilU family type 4a pilus ATPase [Thiohalomonadales bacterium]